MPVSRTELEGLVDRKGRVLSVYLDVDQSNAANLRRGFMPALKDRLRSIDAQLSPDLKPEFAADAERVLQFMAGYDPRARTLVLFSDTSEGFFWDRELHVPVPTDVRWDVGAHVRPLVEILDEHQRYVVVLVSREAARLFTVYMGRIEEDREIFSPDRRKRFKQTAKDNRMSSLNLQRKDDEHARLHARDVAAALEELAGRCTFDRLLLGGQPPITRELESELSKSLQARVITSMSLPVDAGDQEVLAETGHLHEQRERAGESETVERLITLAAKDTQAVLDLKPTLEAMRLGRILKLVYVHDLSVPGAQCANCLSLFDETVDACSFCEGKLRPETDVVSRLVELVLRAEGQMEAVRGPAAERLRAAGRIGAFLRF
jgi:peptide subunit release factor 1 (eRF1)